MQRILAAAARAGEVSVVLETASWGSVQVAFVDRPDVERWARDRWRVERIVLRRTLPLEEGRAVRDRTKRRASEAYYYRPVVHLALGAEAAVGPVINSLECYAVTLHLAERNSYSVSAVCLTGIGSG